MPTQVLNCAPCIPRPGALARQRRPAPTLSGILSRAVNSFAAKRVLDVLGAALALVLLSPLFLLVAVLVKATDGGPVFFVQRRVGRNGVLFDFYKFRSMVVDAPRLRDQLLEQNIHGAGITFKLEHDHRVTWIGRVIRRLSIDELPQLWNVLKGNMSLVGPRPPMPEEVARYRPADRGRLAVLPGITCLWQVRGRAHLCFEKQVKLDLEYIRTRTLWLDLRLLLQTVPAVLSCRGAY